MEEVGGSWVTNILFKGGAVMYPILFCSIFAVAIIMERFFALRWKKVIHPELITHVRNQWLKGDVEKALLYCRNNDNAMSRILIAGLLRSKMGLLEIERAIEGAGEHEAIKLGANLRGLGVIANLTPMLGLLGTVIGMIRAFDVISVSGTGDPSLVANGISEALITTAAGLVVGIPTLAIYYYFRGRVDRLVFEMEEVSVNLIEELTKNSLQKEHNGVESEV